MTRYKESSQTGRNYVSIHIWLMFNVKVNKALVELPKIKLYNPGKNWGEGLNKISTKENMLMTKRHIKKKEKNTIKNIEVPRWKISIQIMFSHYYFFLYKVRNRTHTPHIQGKHSTWAIFPTHHICFLQLISESA